MVSTGAEFCELTRRYWASGGRGGHDDKVKLQVAVLEMRSLSRGSRRLERFQMGGKLRQASSCVCKKKILIDADGASRRTSPGNRKDEERAR